MPNDDPNVRLLVKDGSKIVDVIECVPEGVVSGILHLRGLHGGLPIEIEIVGPPDPGHWT